MSNSETIKAKKKIISYNQHESLIGRYDVLGAKSGYCIVFTTLRIESIETILHLNHTFVKEIWFCYEV